MMERFLLCELKMARQTARFFKFSRVNKEISAGYFLTAVNVQNFACTITEAQFINNLVNADGSPTALAVILDNLNLFFTLLFTVELAVNMFSHWFQPFIQNAWSLLDTFIVAMSVMSLIVTNQPTGIVRILRALRVIRLFGRVKSLRKIISALSLALMPVLNVFLILFLLMGICELQKVG